MKNIKSFKLFEKKVSAKELSLLYTSEILPEIKDIFLPLEDSGTDYMINEYVGDTHEISIYIAQSVYDEINWLEIKDSIFHLNSYLTEMGWGGFNLTFQKCSDGDADLGYHAPLYEFEEGDLDELDILADIRIRDVVIRFSRWVN